MHRQRIDTAWQGKNDVEVRHRQEFCASSLYPIFSFVTLTLRAMPIAARVVANSESTTTIASIDMTTQLGCSTFFNGVKRAELPRI
jgi:hypothetical protein